MVTFHNNWLFQVNVIDVMSPDFREGREPYVQQTSDVSSIFISSMSMYLQIHQTLCNMSKANLILDKLQLTTK